MRIIVGKHWKSGFCIVWACICQRAKNEMHEAERADSGQWTLLNLVECGVKAASCDCVAYFIVQRV